MAVTLPRLLRRLGAALGHFQYALPLALPCPAVVTIHDLSFEREPSLMSRKDRLVFKRVVPRAARKARRVLTVSERTRRDLRELYDVPDEKIVVTPNGVDPAFTPGGRTRTTTSSSSAPSRSGRTRSRRSPRRPRPGCRSSSPGRPRTRRSRASSSGAAPASPATSTRTSSSASTAAPPASCSRRATRASACPCSRRWPAGRPSSRCRSPRSEEVAGEAAVWAEERRARRRDPPRRRRA